MPAATHNIEIEQGATYQQRFVWKTSGGAPYDLTGYTARMQVRKSVAAATTLLELTTANGGISLGGVAGTIDLLITAAQTAGLTTNGVYDLELVNGTVVTRLLAGSVTVSKEVTR